ncbi:MAG: hypothetical protein ACK5MB_00005, partial [Phycisphaerales bacterium]
SYTNGGASSGLAAAPPPTILPSTVISGNNGGQSLAAISVPTNTNAAKGPGRVSRPSGSGPTRTATTSRPGTRGPGRAVNTPAPIVIVRTPGDSGEPSVASVPTP